MKTNYLSVSMRTFMVGTLFALSFISLPIHAHPHHDKVIETVSHRHGEGVMKPLQCMEHKEKSEQVEDE